MEERIKILKKEIHDALNKGWDGFEYNDESKSISAYDITLIQDYCSSLGLKATRISKLKDGQEITGIRLTVLPPEPPEEEDGIEISLRDYQLLKWARENKLVQLLYKFK